MLLSERLSVGSSAGTSAREAVNTWEPRRLAKVIRDQQEASTVRVRIDEARIEKLMAEHNPLNSV